MTAKSYINSLTWQEFEQIRVLKDVSPDFFRFLAEPCKDVVTVASFAMKCEEVGIPKEFTRTPDSLHFLVRAITDRAYGNA